MLVIVISSDDRSHDIWCGGDGWAYLQDVVDCCTSEWLGYVFDQRCRAQESQQLLNEVVARRFPQGRAPGTRLRVDNGPNHRADAFVKHAQGLGFDVEHIMVRTPEQNGCIESNHAAFARDYLDLEVFDSFAEARAYIANAWVDHETVKPRQRLGWKTPREYYESFQSKPTTHPETVTGEPTTPVTTTS